MANGRFTFTYWAKDMTPFRRMQSPSPLTELDPGVLTGNGPSECARVVRSERGGDGKDGEAVAAYLAACLAALASEGRLG